VQAASSFLQQLCQLKESKSYLMNRKFFCTIFRSYSDNLEFLLGVLDEKLVVEDVYVELDELGANSSRREAPVPFFNKLLHQMPIVGTLLYGKIHAFSNRSKTRLPNTFNVFKLSVRIVSFSNCFFINRNKVRPSYRSFRVRNFKQTTGNNYLFLSVTSITQLNK
jgi:hypothetical protein